ncbi:hypothetical protein UY3_07417 [Chelonia mydas]|uniref:Uncharacterized protein n=1 Tax=Chelonia mydas TaxID=8469 RepID=M7BE49_CHEMY|nr:hypothetical protein UY3_07417 [Chelonia mydas]
MLQGDLGGGEKDPTLEFKTGKVAVNSTIPGTNNQLQPDIVITNEDRKKIVIVDVTVLFENRTPDFP